MHPRPAKLTEQHEKQLDAQRRWIAGHFDNPEDYSDPSNQLTVVASILDNGWIEPHETAKLQCLGVAFGDALADTVGLTWVTFEADGEAWPGLRFAESSLFVHPVTMIAKRVEKGVEFDVIELFRQIATQIESLKGQVD